jgi:ubiquinone/menaquinone biosynthesis C-methylase UbiE
MLQKKCSFAAMAAESNQEVYESSDVVESYQHQKHLTKGEQFLFRRHKDDLTAKKVLDLGVGAGRTTPYLAKEAGEYWGVDYSKAMVESCKLRFRNLKNARFVSDDARSLSTCADGYFDTVLFSFNGIDVVDFNGREKVLNAVRRVLRPGGVFIFSFHNSGTLESLYRYHWQKNPFRWLPNLRRLQQIRKINGPSTQYKGQNYFFLRDGGEDFRLDICYVRPAFQIDQLRDHRFRVEDAVESESGIELTLEQVDQSVSSWIYFRCRKQ